MFADVMRPDHIMLKAGGVATVLSQVTTDSSANGVFEVPIV